MAYFEPGPNFGNTNYPNGGEIVGKAWAGMWHLLGNGRWHGSAALHGAAQNATRCELKTVYNLAHQAHRAGLLEKRYVTERRRRRVEYRRPSA